MSSDRPFGSRDYFELRCKNPECRSSNRGGKVLAKVVVGSTGALEVYCRGCRSWCLYDLDRLDESHKRYAR